jgi:hypothetical protein
MRLLIVILSEDFIPLFTQVWVRGRNGFPVDMGMGSGERKLFVFNIWDIAMKLNNF